MAQRLKLPRFKIGWLPAVLAEVILPVMIRAAEPEVRGTWLTTTANTAIATPQDTTNTMRRLRDVGLNTVYVECWKDGYTEFPSDVMRKTIGVTMKINASSGDVPAVQRDLLNECVAAAHANDLAFVAWFEYGFMAAHKDTHNELRDRHRDWLSLNRDGGDVAKNGFVWLNPLHPDAQALLIGIVTEAVRKYDVDGVQLDDRIVWPSLEMGYDEYTKKLYAADHDGREPPADERDREWCRWRAAKVTAFAQRFVREVKAANPNIVASLSPGPYPWAYENYLCDWVGWSTWPDGRRWDEYVPQVYRMNYDAFARDWTEQARYMSEPGRLKNLVAGIRLVGDGPDLPPGDATRSVELVRKTGAAGHCWWFSRGVLETHERELRALYDVPKNGQAPNPILLGRKKAKD